MRSGILLLLLLSSFFQCNEKSASLIKFSGEAQGTTYSVSYLSNDGIYHQAAIDSLLKKIDTSLSTWVPVSIISRINQNDSTAAPDDHFINVLKKAMEVSEITNGDFDFTVGPVINAWGFGFSNRENVDSVMIDSLLDYVGHKMIKLGEKKIEKQKKEIKLDFNAIAQGYTVDVLCEFLESKDIQNYFVELGGEVKAKGTKSKGKKWKVGIDRPVENAADDRSLQAIIELENMALATSGNYRKFYVQDGKKYAHIIDPHTGYPAKHSLLSATVIAGDCMTADAYATAFMVMGLEKAKNFLSEHKTLNLEVYFIYEENEVWKTFTTEGIKGKMKEMN